MRKYYYLIVVLLVLNSCNSKVNNYSSIDSVAAVIIESDPSNYEVKRIDSISNFYIIYAFKNGNYFKIISKKNDKDKCRQIQPSGYYHLELESVLKPSGRNFDPGDITGIGLPGGIEIDIEEDSIYDIHSSKNLIGLCITE